MSPFWILWELRITAVVVTTEAIRRAKLQSNRHQRNKPTPSFSQARWPSLANVRQQNTIKVFLMLSVWEMTVAYVDSLHVRQKKKSLPKDIGLCVELWTYGPSGPSSNDNYLGHFKKLWLLTYLLTYLLGLLHKSSLSFSVFLSLNLLPISQIEWIHQTNRLKLGIWPQYHEEKRVTKMHMPMARRKFSIRTSVFFISDEYTSLPTIGQNGTLLPSSWARANATAVYKCTTFTSHLWQHTMCSKSW